MLFPKESFLFVSNEDVSFFLGNDDCEFVTSRASCRSEKEATCGCGGAASVSGAASAAAAAALRSNTVRNAHTRPRQRLWLWRRRPNLLVLVVVVLFNGDAAPNTMDTQRRLAFSLAVRAHSNRGPQARDLLLVVFFLFGCAQHTRLAQLHLPPPLLLTRRAYSYDFSC